MLASKDTSVFFLLSYAILDLSNLAIKRSTNLERLTPIRNQDNSGYEKSSTLYLWYVRWSVRWSLKAFAKGVIWCTSFIRISHYQRSRGLLGLVPFINANLGAVALIILAWLGHEDKEVWYPLILICIPTIFGAWSLLESWATKFLNVTRLSVCITWHIG